MRDNSDSLLFLRMSQLGISARDESLYTIGMINDILTEKMNDSFEYPEMATQADFDRL